MYNIKVLNAVSQAGLSLFDPAEFNVGEDNEPAGILLRSADLHAVRIPDSVLGIARAGAGVNNIPVARCAEQGIVVFNTPGGNANAVRELTICALLLAARPVAEGAAWCKTLAGQGDEVPALAESGKKSFAGVELAGKTLGVFGLGAIGVLVANAAAALGMEVYGYDPYLSVDLAWRLSRHVRRAHTPEEIYAVSDYISLHVPLNDATRGLVNAAAFARVKPGVRLVNFSRGGIVDNSALLAALNSGQAARYVTDFPEDNLLAHPGVLCIPHLGASTEESEENCARMAVRQLSDYLKDGNIRNAVNLPDAVLERTGDTRVAVIHCNVPNMLARITGVFSADGINIENMLNRSRGEYAYTLLDITGTPGDSGLAHLRALSGVLRVRVI